MSTYESHHSEELKNQVAGIGHTAAMPQRSASFRVDWLDLEDTSWPALLEAGYRATITLQLKTGTERVKWALVHSKQVENLLANQAHPRFPYIIHDWHIFPLPGRQIDTIQTPTK